MNSNVFFNKGWCRFPFDPALADWIKRSLPIARDAVHAPENSEWLRCGGTWFVGVNALTNDVLGAVDNGPPLKGVALDFIHQSLGITDFVWDQAQVSCCYPGYPQPAQSESEAAYRYRCERDAAHIDGLLAEGADRRRHLREYHGFILGIPMTETSADASPFVVWQGSHEIVRTAFAACFEGIAPAKWGDVDVTETYHGVRRMVFDTCKRIEIAAKPGEAYLVHRLAVHGIAPWGHSATAPADGRMICYFRPGVGGPWNWLRDP